MSGIGKKRRGAHCHRLCETFMFTPGDSAMIYLDSIGFREHSDDITIVVVVVDLIILISIVAVVYFFYHASLPPPPPAIVAARGLDPQVIQSFPKVTFLVDAVTAVTFLVDGVAGGEDGGGEDRGREVDYGATECPICLGQFEHRDVF